ncbi:hypothetical protein SARC_13248, partial [Sphaeroforma arctica JP610]
SQNPERVAEFKPMVPRLWSLLFDQCALSEEGMRGVVADCAGKLTVIDPHNCLPMLIERLQSPDATVRCAVITAVKYTIADTPQPIDALLRPLMPQFMSHIEDSDLHVRRVSLVTLNSAAHNKPSLISDQLDTLLPLLYQEAVVKVTCARRHRCGQLGTGHVLVAMPTGSLLKTVWMVMHVLLWQQVHSYILLVMFMRVLL